MVDIEKTYKKVIDANNQLEKFDDTCLKTTLEKRLWWMLSANTDKGMRLFVELGKSPLGKMASIPLLDKMKFFVKCLIKYSYAK